MGWKPADKIAVTLYNFRASGPHQLTVHVGDLLYIQEELDSGEWCRGYIFYEPSKRGIFPSSYISLKDSTTRRIGSQTVVVPAGDDLLVEATQGLREWRWKLRKLYVRGSRERWRPLYHAMEEVVNWRRALVSTNTTLEALQETKVKLSATIDEINRLTGCPLTPRDPATGTAVNCTTTSILELWKLHRDRRADSTSDLAHSGTLRRDKKAEPHGHLHHLFMRVVSIDHTFSENSEIFFFLSGGGREQLSERYLVAMEKGGEKQARSGKSCVFTDLGSKDMESGMFLVCQIIRNGKMLQDKKYHSQHTFRRPYAVGVLDVRTVLQEQDPGDGAELNKTVTMPLYLCGANHESNFATFHTNVIQKTGAKGGQKPGCAITLSLRAFHRKQLSVVRKEAPMLFTKATQTVHKLGFPDVILPGDARNDIYVTLDGGSFSKGTKTAERNVEVVVNVVDKSGTVIPRAIMVGAGAQPSHEYISFIYYHNNNPKWKETFKLAIPFEKVPDAHLRIVFRHLAKDEARDKAEKSFAFAYLKIMKDDGSIISDGPHDLYVYETGNKKWTDPSVYPAQQPPPGGAREESGSGSLTMSSRGKRTLRLQSSPSQSSRGVKEIVTISTLTCSTKLTQRIELLLLLKWRQNSKKLSEVLHNLVKVGGQEVVKFLQDTLDCLFEILNDNHEMYGELVFEALVSIFGLMTDDRYHHFTTVLDIYIEKHFSALLAHKYLLSSFRRNVKDLIFADLQHQKLTKILQSMPYLFKFIVQSSHLYQKQRNTVDPVFIKDFSDVFATFNTLMTITDSTLKGVHLVQKVMLEYFPAVLPELVQVYTHPEIAVFVSDLLNAVKNNDVAVIPQQKLVFISAILHSPVRLLDHERARQQLVPSIVSHLISFMNYQMLRTNYRQDDRGNQEAVHCLGQLLTCLSNHQLQRSPEDVQYVVPLMLPLLKLSKDIPRSNKLSSPNMVNFLMLLALMTDDHFKLFYLSLQSHVENSFGPFVLDMMEVLRDCIGKPTYPDDWCTLHLLQNKVLARTIVNCSDALVQYALDDTAFAPSIWDSFFSLCADFLTQPSLQLDRLSDFRRHHYQQQYGDVRASVGQHVARLWHRLGDKKGNFIPNFVKPFLQISLIKHKELRRVCLPLIMDIMECEQKASCNFKRVETEVFDKMDELVTSGRGDEEYRELFQDILCPLCASNDLGTTGEVFISSVSRLIGLLLDYRNVSSDEGHKDRRMGCMLNLLNFYREIEKEELYIRYIYKLAELHQKDQSFTEAGFTLLLRAEGLEWSIEPVPPEGKFAEEVEQRTVKEQLYKEVINLFDKGQAWEHGIPLCKDLCSVYEAEFRYNDLAVTLQREAELFQKIVRELRVEPEYFMVGSYGRGFPLFLRNKIFIHRGLPYERLSSFIKRLTDEYSTAELLKDTKPPEDDIKNSSGMYLQVRTVQTIPEEQKRFEGKTVPDSVSRYYKANDVSKFRYDRPFHRGEKRKDCEIATLWLERTNFVTTKKFPGEMAWFEIASMEQVELDPLAIAIETVSSKTSEVRVLTALHSENKNLNINPLSMLLSGLIDAAVGGGIKNYRMVFFQPEYLASHPGDENRVKELKRLIEEQLAVLKKGLDVHGRRIAPSLRGMQENLEARLEEMVSDVFPERTRRPTRAQTVKQKRDPLPPIPHTEPTSSQTMAPRRRPTGKMKNRVSQLSESPPQPAISLRRSETERAPPKQPLPYIPRKPESSVSRDGPAISEEDDEDIGGAYESVDDLLRCDLGPTAPSVPPRSVAVQSAGQRVAPRHDYTPVGMGEGSGVQLGQQPADVEEEDVFATLPLKISPQPGKHSTFGTWATSPQGSHTISPSGPPHPRLSSSPSQKPVPLPSGLSPSPPAADREATDGEQPSLPPKRRKSRQYSEPDTSKWRNPPPKIPAPVQEDARPNRLSPAAPAPTDEDVYNHLTVAPGKGESPRASPGHSPSPSAQSAGDDEVYFNHLAEPLPGKKPHPPPPPTSRGEDVYFDHLPGPLVPPKPSPNEQPPLPAKPHPPAPPTSGGDQVYFDHLAKPLRPKPSSNEQPPLLAKPHPPTPPTSGGDDVYFNHLAGPLPPKPSPPSHSMIKPGVSSADSAPPPVPMKKNKPQRQASEDTPTPERPIPRPRAESQMPIPAPRGTPPQDSTPPPAPSRPPKHGAPALPPKPSAPKLSSKPSTPIKGAEPQPPPRPAKNKPVT